MDVGLRRHVRQRADNRCEYCGVREQSEPLAFHIEHIIARQHGGIDVAENLALACNHCNLHKGTNLAAIDPATGEVTRLFHPRLDNRRDHFIDEPDGIITGLTSIGRTTVGLLKMNRMGRIQLRRGE